jgi:hypothetical protein
MQILYNNMAWHASLGKLPGNCIIFDNNLNLKLSAFKK